MMKKKPVTVKVNEYYRIINLPFHVDDEVIKSVGAVEGVNDVRQGGQYEVCYEVGRCFSIDLVDHNVIFAVEEYMKRREADADNQVTA
jgi:hypothetical protein